MAKLLLVALACLISVAVARRRHQRGVHCGSGWSNYVVPDDPPVPIICEKKPQFGPSCQIHDNCYDTCGRTQEDCDKQFLENMRKGCKDQGFTVGICAAYCNAGAMLYYKAVANFGATAFEQAQTASRCGIQVDFKDWVGGEQLSALHGK